MEAAAMSNGDSVGLVCAAVLMAESSPSGPPEEIRNWLATMAFLLGVVYLVQSHKDLQAYTSTNMHELKNDMNSIGLKMERTVVAVEMLLKQHLAVVQEKVV
jgi:hypothetical protein